MRGGHVHQFATGPARVRSGTVREENTENRINILERSIGERFDITGSTIENAHRTGKPAPDRPRHIIARFYSRAVRAARNFFLLSMLRAWAVFNCLIWGFWVIGLWAVRVEVLGSDCNNRFSNTITITLLTTLTII